MAENTLVESYLDGFTWTENWYSHWLRKCVFTDGVKYMAEKAGAFWLIDAIASYQIDKKVLRNENLQQFQLWKLVVKNGKAVLTCQEDSDVKPAITQKIPYTDFPLPILELYVEPMGDGKMCILLKNEH